MYFYYFNNLLNRFLSRAIKENLLEDIQFLKASGIKIEPDEDAKEFLIQPLRKHNFETFSTMIDLIDFEDQTSKNEFLLNITDKKGCDLLCWSVETNRIELFEFLLSLDEVDLYKIYDGRLLLEIAYEKGHVYIFQNLMRKYAFLNELGQTINSRYDNALIDAFRTKDLETLRAMFIPTKDDYTLVNHCLRSRFNGFSLLYHAIAANNVGGVEFLIGNKIGDLKSNEILNLASKNIDKKIIELLEEYFTEYRDILEAFEVAN